MKDVADALNSSTGVEDLVIALQGKYLGEINHVILTSDTWSIINVLYTFS